MIQPHLPIRLPCYDFTPVIGPTFGSSLLTVGSLTSGVTDSFATLFSTLVEQAEQILVGDLALHLLVVARWAL